MHVSQSISPAAGAAARALPFAADPSATASKRRARSPRRRPRSSSPIRELVERLRCLLARTQPDIVAHFYMDAELQGVLSACGAISVHIADSLQMADRAVKMAEQGARAIVRARRRLHERKRARDARREPASRTCRCTGAASSAIGCSLAESAETRAYLAYLQHAARTPRSLHVIYMNTSLRVKAEAQSAAADDHVHVVERAADAAAGVRRRCRICTSGSGPTRTWARTSRTCWPRCRAWTQRAIAELHPAHTPQTLAAAHARFHYFEQGVCIVHHMFGDAVVAQVAARLRRMR